MNSITQIHLFEDHELGDLEKLFQLFEVLPDEALITGLDDERKNGRNDYPNLVMWRLMLAMFVLQHPTVESLRRELMRNNQLRQACGLYPIYWTDSKGLEQVRLAPSAAAFTRFQARLAQHSEAVETLFFDLVLTLMGALDDFGQTLAIDGKLIQSYAPNDKREKASQGGGRQEKDASYKVKTYRDKVSGRVIKKVTVYGFCVHLICDTTYELPIAFEVTPANQSEVIVAEELIEKVPLTLRERVQYVLADAGYDSTAFILRVEDLLQCTALIDNRHMWGGDETRQYQETDLIYDQSGNVWWVDDQGEAHSLRYRGYDSSSDSLRYSPHYADTPIYRIKRSEDIRIFPKVARTSQKYQRVFRGRSAIERVNGRLDRDFMFENHTIRGLAKMTLHVSMAFIIQLGYALCKVAKQETSHLAAWVA